MSNRRLWLPLASLLLIAGLEAQSPAGESKRAGALAPTAADPSAGVAAQPEVPSLALSAVRPLQIAVNDPAGDNTGPIDVLRMTLRFDDVTGAYEIRLHASASAPFLGDFRVNINLFNVDANSFFQDTVNDYSLTSPTTTLTLTGSSAQLASWSAGDRVHTNSLFGTPNPPNSTLYRTSVSSVPHGFLTNEDYVAFADPTRPATVRAVSRDLAVDFGPPYGVWILTAAQTWQQLHSLSPVAMVTGDLDGSGLDDLVVNFGPGIGVWAWMNHTIWTFIHSLSPTQMVTGDLNNNGHDDIVFVFPGSGLWRWSDGGWSNLHGLAATQLAVGNLDGLMGADLVADFPGAGLYVFANNTSWTRLHGLDATALITADLDSSGRDDVIVNFGAPHGLWVYRNNAVWSQLHGLSPARVAAGDIDDSGRADLVIDFGTGIGLWMFRNNTTWGPLNGLSAEAVVLADRDGTGQAEIVIDFGPTWGLWQYTNDSTWNQLHRLSPQAIKAGAFH